MTTSATVPVDQIKLGSIYVLRNKASGFVWDVAEASQKNGARLLAYPPQPGFPSNERFIFFPLDNEMYAVASQHSGRCIDVSGGSVDDVLIQHTGWFGRTESRTTVPIIQWPWNGGDHQKFIIRRAGDGSFYFLAAHSGKAITQGSLRQDGRLGADLVQSTYNNSETQFWQLLEVDRFDLPKLSQPTQLANLPDVFDGETPPEEWPDKPVVVAESLIPCFLVKDVVPIQVRIRESPHVVFRRREQWVHLGSKEFPKGIQKTEVYATTWRWSTKDATTLETKCGISVTGEAGLKFSPASASISTKLTYELRAKQSTEVDLEKTVSYKQTLASKGAAKIEWHLYLLAIRFELVDANRILEKVPPVLDFSNTREKTLPSGAIGTAITTKERVVK